VRIDADGQTATQVATFDATAQHRIQGPSRELLAIILGRPVGPELDADASAITAFRRTFPGP